MPMRMARHDFHAIIDAIDALTLQQEEASHPDIGEAIEPIALGPDGDDVIWALDALVASAAGDARRDDDEHAASSPSH